MTGRERRFFAFLWTCGLLVLPAIATFAQQPRIYYFTKSNCPPCVRMAPGIDELIRQGLPVTKIDVQVQPEWARQFQVSQTPTIVVVDGNRIVARHEGLLDTAQLQNLTRPFFPTAPTKQTLAGEVDLRPIHRPVDYPEPSVGNTRLGSTVHQGTREPANEIERRAMAATVRLRMERDHDLSYATGTIIHAHQSEALVLTCGHLFRDSAGQGRLTAEIGWLGGQVQAVPATLLNYNAENRDVALVIIRADAPLIAVPLAPANRAVETRTAVFSIGCDRGDAPTIRRSAIKNIATYDGATKYDIMGRPVVGRSGGGLFNAEGELIGVCNAAAVDVDEGIYSALENIYWQISQSRLTHLFQARPTEIAQASSAPQGNSAPPITLAAAQAAPEGRSLPTIRPAFSANEAQRGHGLDSNPMRSQSDTGSVPWEAIIVLRNPANPSETRTFTVQNPDPSLLSSLIGGDYSAGHERAPDAVNVVDSNPGHRGQPNHSGMAPISPPRQAQIRAQSPR
ncbi:MAG TPA: trypsin-like peptidase domain-containing protein [Pirellulaceae bacterium]|nr:trypsin-like peptidase domain-containing protein [Pirellulaceae bacterium]